MNNVFIILRKVFVKEFYRLNAGFFILIITLAFGFMSGAEHRALAEYFVSSPLFAVIPIVIWLLYMLKIMFFNRQRINLTENKFLLALTLLPRWKQFLSLTQTLALQFAPAWAYAIFICLIALKNNRPDAITIICTGIILLLVAFTQLLQRDLSRQKQETKVWFFKRLTDRYFVRPIWWIYLTAIVRNEPVLFLATKIFTGLLLFAICQLYHGEAFDVRLLAMGASLAAVCNYSIVQQLQLIDFRTFSLLKNLPIPLLKRWSVFYVVVFLVMIPEVAVVCTYAPRLSWLDISFAVMLLPSIAVMSYALLYMPFEEEKTLPRIIFALSIAHILLILFRVPIASLAFVDSIASCLIFVQRYYKFEMRSVDRIDKLSK